MNRRKLHCPTIIKKSKTYARKKKHPLKNQKKYKKSFYQALLILYGKKKYWLKLLVPVPVPAPAPDEGAGAGAGAG